MSKVEMLCWSILAMQVMLMFIGWYIAGKVGQILHIARKAESDTVVLYEDTDAHARFKRSLEELERTIDSTFQQEPLSKGPKYHV